MRKLYPLKFRPTPKEKVWGEEIWEVAAMDEDPSEIENGFLAGNDLADILETYMGELVGDAIFDWYNLQFPLLVKLLNVKDRLSVQVHPDDETAFDRFYSSGKTEFWYVVSAGPGAKAWIGFKRETDGSEFYTACRNGTVTELMNEYRPQPGDCFFIPAGTVHACGGDLLIAEIQESSDLAFRLYDWGRENDPATARQMHLDEAIDCIDYQPYDPANRKRKGDGITALAKCPHFAVRSIDVTGTFNVRTGAYSSCVVYFCTEGEAVVQSGSDTLRLARGESLLVPASLDEILVSPVQAATHLLEIYVPQPAEEADSYMEEK